MSPENSVRIYQRNEVKFDEKKRNFSLEIIAIMMSFFLFNGEYLCAACKCRTTLKCNDNNLCWQKKNFRQDDTKIFSHYFAIDCEKETQTQMSPENPTFASISIYKSLHYSQFALFTRLISQCSTAANGHVSNFNCQYYCQAKHYTCRARSQSHH